MQGSLSSQVAATSTGLPLHLPPAQASPEVHGSPSSQVPEPGSCLHGSPFAKASQLSVVQGSPSSQESALPALHRPPAQPSLPVQGLPSLHVVPVAALLQMHAAVFALQAPTMQSSPEAHAFAAPALQVAPSHTSGVQASPSRSHPAPGVGACWQPVSGWHPSDVHGSPSSQLLALP